MENLKERQTIPMSRIGEAQHLNLNQSMIVLNNSKNKT